MNSILMSTSSRVLVVATGVVLVSAIVLLTLGVPSQYVIFAAIALAIVRIVLHRHDMTRAIVQQLQRDADDTAAGRSPQEDS